MWQFVETTRAEGRAYPVTEARGALHDTFNIEDDNNYIELNIEGLNMEK